ALVHASVTRPYSHSLSDDERLYKHASEREQEALRDPLRRFSDLLLREGILDRGAMESIAQEIDAEVARIAQHVLHEPSPAPESLHEFLYSPKVDPCSNAFDAAPAFHGEPRTMVDAINQTL